MKLRKGVSELIAMLLIIIILVSGLITMYVLYQNLMNAQSIVLRSESIKNQMIEIESNYIEATYKVTSSLTINITNHWTKDINLISVICTFINDSSVISEEYSFNENIPPGHSSEVEIDINQNYVVKSVMLVFQEGFVISASKYTPTLAPQYDISLIPYIIPSWSSVTLGKNISTSSSTINSIDIITGTYVSGQISDLYDGGYYIIKSEPVPRPDWLAGWDYRKPITIYENSGETLAGYPVKIELNSANFDFDKANDDGSDIRFTLSDGVTELAFYIESWDKVEQSAIVWVKIPEIPANGQVLIYMYYHNPSATLPSYATIENVFTLIGEAGTVNTDQNTATVYFNGEYDEPPLIFASIDTFNGGDTVVSRIRTRTKDYFTIRLEEYYYDDGPHAIETIGWIALKPGIWVIGGKVWEVGTVNAGSAYTTVNLQYSFPGTPVIITYINSYNEGGFSGTLEAGAHTRQDDPTSTSFRVKIEEQTDTYHPSETIGYIAIYGENYQFTFWGYWLQIYYTSSTTINGLRFEAARFYPYAYWYINNYADGWEPSYWRIYRFHLRFSTSPVIVFKVQSERGGDNCHERLNYASTSSFYYGLQETPAYDGRHTYEWGGFIAIEPGLIYGYQYVAQKPTYSIGAEQYKEYGVTKVKIDYIVASQTEAVNITLIEKYNTTVNAKLYIWNKLTTEWEELKSWTDISEIDEVISKEIGSDYIGSNNNITLLLESIREYVPIDFTQYIDRFTVTCISLKSVNIYIAVNNTNQLLRYDIESEEVEEINCPLIDKFYYPSITFDEIRRLIWLITYNSSSGESVLLRYSILTNSWELISSTDLFKCEKASSLIFVKNYPDSLFLINGVGATYLYRYDIAGNSWYIESMLPLEIDEYSVTATDYYNIYVIGQYGETYMYNLSSREWIELELSPTSYPVGFTYDEDRDVLWLLCKGGGIFYYDIANNVWRVYEQQIPYTPIEPGNRLLYYNNRLFHVRCEYTRQIWIIYL